MLRNKQYFTKDGAQLSVYFMEVMGISQGMFAGFSHRMRQAIDDAGRGAGIDSAFAPFDLKVVWKKQNGSKTGILVTNTRRILTPIGFFDPFQVNILLWHDNNTSDLWVGKEIKQGTRFYEEGTADNATGNHIHFMVSFKKYDGKYPLYQTLVRNWALKNQASPVDLFFVNDTVRRNDKGYDWKTYSGEILGSPAAANVPITPKKVYYVVQKGDTLSRIAVKYKTTWQKIYQANIDVIGKNPNSISVGMKLLIP